MSNNYADWTNDSLERELERAQEQANKRDEAADVLRTCESDVERVRAMASSFDSLGGGASQAVKNSVAVVEANIAEQLQEATQRRDEAREQARQAEQAKKRMAQIAAAIAAREKQVSRFNGLLGSGLGGPFGETKFKPSKQDLRLILSMAFVERVIVVGKDGHSKLSACKSVTKREEIEAQIAARWEQAQADIRKWVTENEVQHYAIRAIRYSTPNGAVDTSLLYRVQFHRPELVGRWVIDDAAKMFFVPFDQFKVQAEVGGGSEGALLTEWTYMIDGKGEASRAIVIQPVNFQ